MTDYSMDTARTRFIFGHPDWEIEIQGSEHIGRDFDAWVRKLKAETLREAADWKREHNLGNSVWGDYLLELAHEKYQAGGDDMITIWLIDRADRIEKGE